jgi:tetratricopeptide (TPR) repeat protein
LVAAALLLLLSLAGSVTRRADAFRERVAEQHYQQGLGAESSGARKDAESRFRAALAVSRDHPPYRLALARVLLDQGRWQEAENHLKELAAQDPTSGVINLLLARARRAGKRYNDAVADYQRAIYGYWPPDQNDQRLAARGEMAAMLASTRDWRRLNPVLMQWRDELPAGSPDLREVARLFFEAGSPDDAARVWRSLHDANPKDASTHLGVGQAEFAAGNYAAALAAFREALRLDRNSKEASDGAGLAESIVVLDPTEIRLPTRERLARAIHLAETVIIEYDKCADNAELAAARQRLAETPRRSMGDQNPDDWIQLAERLWQQREAACGAGGVRNQALPYVFTMLEKSR